MELVHQLATVCFPILAILLFIFVVPVLWLFRLVRLCIRSVFREELAGKVVLITGASSGIGEHLAYEYAKNGARLALVARREELLAVVAEKALELGSPEAIVIAADVSKVEDCKRFVDETINHFGKLDYLINNAGIGPSGLVGLFEDERCITNHIPIMDVNFWGSVYATNFVLPHLRKSRGRIVVIGSCGGWLATPRASVYNASKAALLSFFETIRMELGSDVGITMVTLGMIDTPLTNNDDFLAKANLKWLPRKSVERCVKSIVNSARRGDKYLSEPAWLLPVPLVKLLLPEILDLICHLIVVTGPEASSRQGRSRDTGSIQPLDIKSD